MRVLEVHTCPLWEDEDGSRRVGMEPEEDHPPVVGWVNVLVVDVDGDPRLLLVGAEADR